MEQKEEENMYDGDSGRRSRLSTRVGRSAVDVMTKGGATDIKMVRQNRDAAGTEASAEGTRIEAPYGRRRRSPLQPTRGYGGAS